MQEQSSISFAIEPLSSDAPELSIVPILNGTRLTALVEEFERDRFYEPVGGYAGLVPSNFKFGPLDQYFMASSESPAPDQHYYVLGCKCGEVGCWPLEVRIVTKEREVVWEAFRQPFRRERDYSDFGPFRFELGQYLLKVVELDSAFHKR